jgi:hypothetical protein
MVLNQLGLKFRISPPSLKVVCEVWKGRRLDKEKPRRGGGEANLVDMKEREESLIEKEKAKIKTQENYENLGKEGAK